MIDHFCSFLVPVSLIIPHLYYFIACIWQVYLWDWGKNQFFKLGSKVPLVCVLVMLRIMKTELEMKMA